MKSPHPSRTDGGRVQACKLRTEEPHCGCVSLSEKVGTSDFKYCGCVSLSKNVGATDRQLFVTMSVHSNI
jgi:hypothetical protein